MHPDFQLCPDENRCPDDLSYFLARDEYAKAGRALAQSVDMIAAEAIREEVRINLAARLKQPWRVAEFPLTPAVFRCFERYLRAAANLERLAR